MKYSKTITYVLFTPATSTGSSEPSRGRLSMHFSRRFRRVLLVLTMDPLLTIGRGADRGRRIAFDRCRWHLVHESWARKTSIPRIPTNVSTNIVKLHFFLNNVDYASCPLENVLLMTAWGIQEPIDVEKSVSTYRSGGQLHLPLPRKV